MVKISREEVVWFIYLFIIDHTAWSLLAMAGIEEILK